MTTILSNDKFIISDKRATLTFERKLSERCFYDSSEGIALIDHEVKIIVEPYVRELFYKEKRVMAIAYAGNHKSHLTFINFIKKTKIKDLHALAYCALFFENSASFSIVTMMEDGSRNKIAFNGSFDFASYPKDDKTLSVFGSGAGYYSREFSDLVKNEKITLEEVFLYLVYRDKHSSADYSVYSLDEDRLYTIIKPEQAYIKEKALKAHNALDIIFNKEKVDRRKI